MTDAIEEWLGPLPVLRRVVPVVHEGRTASGRVVISSVELWDHCVRVHGARFPGPTMEQMGDAGMPADTLRDDVGTAYRYRNAGGSGDGRGWHEAVAFTPAVPAGATQLILDVFGVEEPVVVDL